MCTHTTRKRDNQMDRYETEGRVFIASNCTDSKRLIALEEWVIFSLRWYRSDKKENGYRE